MVKVKIDNSLSALISYNIGILGNFHPSGVENLAKIAENCIFEAS